eukprot:6492402-Amphidinium_carterae.2
MSEVWNRDLEKTWPRSLLNTQGVTTDELKELAGQAKKALEEGPPRSDNQTPPPPVPFPAEEGDGDDDDDDADDDETDVGLLLPSQASQKGKGKGKGKGKKSKKKESSIKRRKISTTARSTGASSSLQDGSIAPAAVTPTGPAASGEARTERSRSPARSIPATDSFASNVSPQDKMKANAERYIGDALSLSKALHAPVGRELHAAERVMAGVDKIPHLSMTGLSLRSKIQQVKQAQMIAVDKLANTTKQARSEVLTAIADDITHWPESWVCLYLLVFTRNLEFPGDINAWQQLINPNMPDEGALASGAWACYFVSANHA